MCVLKKPLRIRNTNFISVLIGKWEWDLKLWDFFRVLYISMNVFKFRLGTYSFFCITASVKSLRLPSCVDLRDLSYVPSFINMYVGSFRFKKSQRHHQFFNCQNGLWLHMMMQRWKKTPLLYLSSINKMVWRKIFCI